MKKPIGYILAIVFIVTLISCNNHIISIVNAKSFKNDIWNSFDKVTFENKINDKENTYKLSVKVELTDKFPSNRFSFGLSQKSDDGESIFSNFDIAVRDSNGKLDGEKIEGYYNYTFVINRKLYFNSLGTYSFVIENTMNQLNMPGVHKIILEIELN
jgi:gliding motility-associated lipoprotein GldH